MVGTPWTDSEVEILKGLWDERLSAPKIAEKLGRTPHAVWHKAQHYGLPRRLMLGGYWADGIVNTLIRLWKEGWSATEIRQKEPNLAIFSRNAVLGKLHRLGLLGTRPADEVRRTHLRTHPARPRPQRQIKPQTIFTLPVESISDPLPQERISLVDLMPWHCRYPFNDEAPYTFCGRPKHYGSYCLSHARICYRDG